MTPGALVNHQTASVQLHRRVGDHELNRLAVRKRPAEGRPDFGIVDHHIQRSACDAHWPRSVTADATFLNPTLRDGKPLALAADQIGGRYSRVLEHNLPRR